MKARNRHQRIDSTPDFNPETDVYTYTGRRVTPIGFDVTMPTIIDIAHALANIARYNGHSHEFYSVAQHCCMLAHYTSEAITRNPADCLYVLMHDAAEAYIGDMVRSVKIYDDFFNALEDQIMTIIWRWLGISRHHEPAFLKEIDTRITEDERMVLKLGQPNPDIAPLHLQFEPWSPDHAERTFLTQYTAYMHGVHKQLVYHTCDWDGFETASDDPYVRDLIEVDILGKVGRIKVRNEDDDVLERDRGKPYPVPRWRWMHGEFQMQMRGRQSVIRKG